MKSRWQRTIFVLSAGAALLLAAPRNGYAQDQKPEQPAPRTLWSLVKQGKLSFSARFRFETFQRDGAPFTAPAYAPTLRLALGYETPAFHGFTAFAQGEAVIVTGQADYNIPTLPSQVHPDRPVINDPKSLELSQGYVRWTHRIASRNLALTVGRQEISLNDGRFLNFSNWRQVHGSFDAARADVELPSHFSFTYAFINRFYRQVGYDATDGHPLMHTDMWNLAWTRPERIRVALYGLLLNYQAPAQFTMSTQTYGLRANGPWQLGKDWKLIYSAEYAKQKNYGTNPNRVDANYYLGELGPGWRGFGLKAGYALLGGRSLTDKLSTPLSPPFNGGSDLFFNNPSGGGGNGLEARYLNASGPIQFLDGTVATLIFYDYHSDNLHVHYGRELDTQLAYKMKRISNRWEIGWRFSRYWSINLFTPALRTSVYTSFTL
jgi:hypothetical protein